MKTIPLITLVVTLAVAAGSAAAAQGPQQLFQQALSAERAEGRLEEAIRLYQRVLAEAGSDRALASRALLQIGRCYEKLGEGRARDSYERLLREYGDQGQVASEARTRLAALTRSAPAAASIRPLPKIGVGDVQAISPDGSRAVIGDYSKGQNLALHDFASGQTRPFTDLDWTNAWAWGAAWSADGRHVAYAQTPWKSESIAELRVTNLTGETRTVFSNASAPGRGVLPAGWLPDGSAILAVVERPDRTAAMGLVRVEDGRFTPLKSFSWAFKTDDLPRLSRDGRFVAFVERGGGPADVQVLSLDGQQAYRVTDHPAEDREPVWSPDGRHLAFVSSRLGAEALWAVAMDGGQPRGEPFKVKDGMHGVELLDWTPGGITAVQHLASWDLYTVGVDPAAARTIGAPRALPYSRTGRNVSPAWSPDGQSLAFISGSTADPGTRHVVVVPEGGRPREFAIPTTRYEFPQAPYDLRWFGNGTGLGFSGTDSRGDPVAFHLTLATGEWRTFPIPAKSWTRIEWNDDGSAFYYARHNYAEPDGGLFERRADGTAERRIYTTPPEVGSTRAHEISPDRKWIAFQQATLRDPGTERIDIVVVNLASGESRTVASIPLKSAASNDGPFLRLAGWSPDGQVLAQRGAGTGAKPEWILVPVTGEAPRTLAFELGGGASESVQGSLVRWSPDGSRIVFVKSSNAASAFVIEHPLAGVAPSGTSAQR